MAKLGAWLIVEGDVVRRQADEVTRLEGEVAAVTVSRSSLLSFDQLQLMLNGSIDVTEVLQVRLGIFRSTVRGDEGGRGARMEAVGSIEGSGADGGVMLVVVGKLCQG